MRTSKPSLRVGVLAAGLLTAALGSVMIDSARAQAPVPKAIVSSTASGGMIYAGTAAANIIEVRFQSASSRFTIDDVVPIQANAGCAPVPGDVTRATCTAFKRPDGSLKEFHVFGRSGADTISNLAISNPAGVQMIAHGEAGSDELTGGPGADTLLGGEGNDDSLTGKGGADILDGGPGVSDAVSYSDRSTGTFVDLAPQRDALAEEGAPGEGDNVKSTVEDVGATDGDDTLIGNDADNTLLGFDGFDVLAGERGADFLAGGRGDDFLLSTGLFEPVDDGAIDTLHGDFFDSDNEPGSSDSCSFSTADPDIARACE